MGIATCFCLFALFLILSAIDSGGVLEGNLPGLHNQDASVHPEGTWDEEEVELVSTDLGGNDLILDDEVRPAFLKLEVV